MPKKYTKQQGKELIKLARKSIENEFSKKQTKTPDKFQEKRGVFVTLYQVEKKNKKKELRGCIGYPYPTLPLSQAVIKAAISAAFSDFRFQPLLKSELKSIKIEISVLSVPKQTSLSSVKLGTDGLICEFKGHSSLLLPQVATEHNLNKQEFLNILCRKANLPFQVAMDSDFKLFKFQAQIFKEK